MCLAIETGKGKSNDQDTSFETDSIRMHDIRFIGPDAFGTSGVQRLGGSFM